MPDLFTNHRQFLRIPAVLNATFTVKGDPEGRTFPATTRDICVGGTCLQVEKDVDAVSSLIEADESRLSVDIQLETGSPPLKVESETRWSQASVDWIREPTPDDTGLLIGIRFWDVPDDTRDRIQHYVESHTAKDSR